MKLIGNKLVIGSLIALTSSILHANETESPELTVFTAGTPAKASEVNQNFSDLKTYSQTQAALIKLLEDKVTALENQSTDTVDQFTIPVTGDGVLIGYTDRVLHNIDKPFIQIKTDFGMATINGIYQSTDYYLGGFDPLNNAAISYTGAYFTDDACTQNPHKIITNDQIPQLFFTKSPNKIDNNQFFPSARNAYFIAADTAFTKSTTDTTYYLYSQYEEQCNSHTIKAGALIIPAVPVTEGVHGLKGIYSEITIEGFSAPI